MDVVVPNRLGCCVTRSLAIRKKWLSLPTLGLSVMPKRFLISHSPSLPLPKWSLRSCSAGLSCSAMVRRGPVEPSTRHYECRARRIGLSPLSGRYLIVGTSFYYGSAGRDGVAAIWAPKSTVGLRRITRNSRGLAQPGEVFLGSYLKSGRVPRAQAASPSD